MKTKDQILLESIYSRIVLNEMLFQNIDEVKTSVEDQLNEIIKNPDILDWMKKRVIKELSRRDENQVSEMINLETLLFTIDFKETLKSIRDYLSSLQENELNKSLRGDFNTIEQKTKQWHEKLSNASKSFKATGDSEKNFKDTKEYFDVGNGWKIVQLSTKEACKLEGDTMGHCVGSYEPSKIYSLRDPKGRPHATLEMIPDNGKLEIHQIKGKSNKAPKKEYQDMIVKMIRSNPKKYTIIDDGQNIGFYNWDRKFYDPESEEWKDVLNNIIIPKREKIKKNIMSRIRTKVKESYISNTFNDLYKNIYKKIVL